MGEAAARTGRTRRDQNGAHPLVPTSLTVALCHSVGLVRKEFHSKRQQHNNTLAVMQPRVPCYLSTDLPSSARYVRRRKWSGPCVPKPATTRGQDPGRDKQKDREANTNAQG